MNSEKTPAAQADDTTAGGLRIEAGKYYRTRSDQKAGPMRGLGPGFYAWAGGIAGNFETWTASGACFCHGPESAWDIVAEWIDEPAKVETSAPSEFAVGDYVEVRGQITAKYDAGKCTLAYTMQIGPTSVLVFEKDIVRKVNT